MSVLEIRKYPDGVLRREARPVISVDVVQDLIDDMIETMYAAPGVGLAAPQVGVSLQVIVVDVSGKEEASPLLILINPEIVEEEGSVEGEEGCLSLPDFVTNVKRAEKVIVKGLDRNGTSLRVEAGGLLAVALQHEIDHIKGTLILDRAGIIKREFYKKRLAKAASR